MLRREVLNISEMNFLLSLSRGNSSFVVKVSSLYNLVVNVDGVSFDDLLSFNSY